MAEILPKPAGMDAGEWSRMCADVLRVPAMYRYAKTAYGVYSAARAAGADPEARAILNALLAYTESLGAFVSDVSDGLLQGVKAGKLPADTFSDWLQSIDREVKAFSDSIGTSRGLGVLPLVLGLVAGVLAVFSVAWSAFYNWRKLNERKAALDAAMASYSALKLPLPPGVVTPPDGSPLVSIDGGAAVSGGVLIGVGVLFYLLSKKGS